MPDKSFEWLPPYYEYDANDCSSDDWRGETCGKCGWFARKDHVFAYYETKGGQGCRLPHNGCGEHCEEIDPACPAFVRREK